MKTIFNFSIRSLIIVLTLTFASACKKEGTGGKSSVSGHVKHHTKLIPYSIVYIKYGATEFPGTDVSQYDASITSDANAFYEFKELQKGDYYLYGKGNDPVHAEPVTGGIGIKLERNKHSDIDVPVTE
jgi:hypothetical protein